MSFPVSVITLNFVVLRHRVWASLGENPEYWGALGSSHLWDVCVAGPLKARPPHSCYHVEIGRSTSKGVGTNRGEPQCLGSARPPPLEIRYGWPPKNAPFLHMCYLAEFVLSGSNRMGVGMEVPNIWDLAPFEVVCVANPIELRPTSTCYPSNLVVRGARLIAEIRL